MVTTRGKAGLTHGMSHTPIYHVWHTMKARCHSPKSAAYQHYGARGIKVCERWLTFENFLADMGERPEGHSLDRIDTDKNYSPDNCRWLPKAENLGRSNAENPRKRPTQRPQVAEPLILTPRPKFQPVGRKTARVNRPKLKPGPKPHPIGTKMIRVPGELIPIVEELKKLVRQQRKEQAL